MKTFAIVTALAVCVASSPVRQVVTDDNAWIVDAGVNACGSLPCGCSAGDCKSVPGKLEYMGQMKNVQECEATCEQAPAKNCSIWLYSAGSSNCWWRLDGAWSTDDKQNDVTSGCRQHPSGSLACVPGCGTCGAAPTAPPAPFKPTTADNMNGKYILSQTPHGVDTQNKFPPQYKDYPGGVEYFDVYSPPITSYYSQVFWTGLDPVPLPKDIVARYDGRGMAVVGFECDQVRRTPEGDVSVPLDVAYNHHFESNMAGKKSKLERIQFDGPNDPRIAQYEEAHRMVNGHGISHDVHYVVHDLAPENDIPTSQSFGAANGGEYRKSYHGYAPGYAQVIDSPTEFQLTPMQIDTWNRDHMSLTGPTKFVPGPVPRTSEAPISGPDALYSGLLECPLTTRIRKVIEADYATQLRGTCGADGILTSAECFAAAAKSVGQAGARIETIAVSNASLPAGCTVAAHATKPGVIVAVFNAAKSTVQCGGGVATPTHTTGVTANLVTVGVTIDSVKDLVTISLTGPANVWFGVGFNASLMKNDPWALIVDGTGAVSERQLQDQNPGTLLKSSVTVLSKTVNGPNRTVVVTRPLAGLTPQHFTFDATRDTVLNFINAVGSGPTLAYHKDKAASAVAVLPVRDSGSACICSVAPAPFGSGKGSFEYVPTNQSQDIGKGTIGFGNKCAPQPRTDLLEQHNPTCDVRTYTGGQTACHHMFSLLDADQEIPWVDQQLNYSLKFRFWVQPYNASYHTTVKRQTWGIASPVEYDVPKCEEGMEACFRGSDGTWVHEIRGTYTGSGSLVAAHFHCHAPTCLSMAMYRCNSSVAVCNETTGELLCDERPVYGGTGKVDNPNMDEPGYILQPPCLWGSPEFGLEPPPLVEGYTLHTVKTSNATYAHHGEMAWQQMLLI
eukprot:m.486046 g.486046  ORF g.486046 m.486046 type:complete len:898 (+) comp21742_c0_seq1:58-2751(+)